ncbi:glycosyltransferase family 4 protein [bacterium]|nr:glycosyltransferase family 4 protein [bacterium]
MKLLLARQRIGETFGGAEGYVAMLAGALRLEGASVSLLAQEVDPATAGAGFAVHRAPAWPTNIGGVVSFARAVRRRLSSDPSLRLIAFDRIPGAPYIRAGDGSHRAYLASMGSTLAAKFSIKHRVLLSLEHGAFTHPGLRMVFANSKMVADEIRSEYGVRDDRIQVVYTGLPSETSPMITREDARARLAVPPADRVCLFAGHNFERKGLNTLLHALALARVGDTGRVSASGAPSAGVSDAGRPITLLVAGRGDVCGSQLVVDRLGLTAAVRFLGPVKMPDVFPAADCFVLPTRYDPLARVCLEAARAGLPVITTKRNGFSEWIGDGEGFVLNRSDDIAGLTRLLRAAFAADLPEMGRRLREKTAHLTIERNAQEILSCLGR